MHRQHLVGCGIGIAIALVVVVLSGGSGGSIGVLFAALICPVVMLGAMWFLMGNNRDDRTAATRAASDTTDVTPR
jgi:TRAP-type C4-dicarboxylate transport system permease large subunit